MSDTLQILKVKVATKRTTVDVERARGIAPLILNYKLFFQDSFFNPNFCYSNQCTI